jgi:hypothetical protein
MDLILNGRKIDTGGQDQANSGDKTDTSNVAVWPYDDNDWQYLRGKLSVEKIARPFG